MGKLTEKKQINLLAVLAFMVYFSSYVTRINFGAVVVEFIRAEGVDKSAASVIPTVLFVTYGAGQLLSGYLGDRISPVKLIFVGLLVAAFANLTLPLVSPNILVMAVVWGINGLAQAFMWPPLVKILTGALTASDYARIVPSVSVSSGSATVAIYLFAPVIIGVSGWKLVFVITAGVAVAAAVAWLLISGRLLRNVDFGMVSGKPRKAEKPEEKTELDKALWKLLPIALLAICVQGMLRDGISTWMPTFMSETFQMESTVSILTGVALPVMHMLVSLITYRVLMAMKRDVFAAIAAFFALATVLALSLRLFGTGTMVMALVLMALLNGAVHGINSLQTCYLPSTFSNKGNMSFLAGFLNSATYVGSALSTYLFAVISEKHGWNATIISWIVFAAVGLLLTVSCIMTLRRRKLIATA